MALTGLTLRCPLAECTAIDMTASGAKTSGQMEKLGTVVGVWATAVANGAKGAFIIKAPKVVLPCVAAPSAGYSQGAKLYYVAGTTNLTSSAGGNTVCAVVSKAAVAAATTVEVVFDGTLGIVS